MSAFERNVIMKHTKLKIISIVCVITMLLTVVSCKKDNKADSSSNKGVSDSSFLNDSEGDISGGITSGDLTDSADPGNTSGGGDASTGGKTSGGGNTSGGGGTSSNTQSRSGSNSDIVITDDLIAQYFNVQTYGAKGNGTVDDTLAIEKAINAAVGAKGGVVYFPAGMYRMTKGLVVPHGVTIIGNSPSLKGDWKEVKQLTSSPGTQASSSNWLNASGFEGTFIVVDHGKGNVNSAPTFRIEGNTAVLGMGFVYKQQSPVTDSVSEFPPAIGMISTKENKYSRDGVAIEDICFANAYIGVAIAQGSNIKDYYVGVDDTKTGISTGRLRIHNIRGGALNKGILIKGILDTVDIQDIKFGYTNYVKSFMTYRHSNCADIELAREDGTMLKNMLSFGAKYGVKATTAFTGASSLRASELNIWAQIPMFAVTGMYKIYNSTFETVNFGGYCSGNEFIGIKVEQDMECVHQPTYLLDNVTVTNSVKASDKTNHCMTLGLGKSGNITISNSTFNGVSGNASYPMITLKNHDSSSIAAIFYSCKFTGSGAKQVGIGTGVINAGMLQFNKCNIPDGIKNTDSKIWYQ